MKVIRPLLLYKLIAQNHRCQVRRHPLFDKNRVMKVVCFFIIAFWAVYLVVLGVSFYSLFKETALEAFDWIDGGLIWFLIADFLARFVMQDTPAQNIKQYKLLNIPTKFLLHTFLLRMGVQRYNLFWFFFFLPFGLLAVPQFYGVGGLAGFLMGWWMAFVLNSYWYLLWRTLINRNLLFCIIPISFYVVLVYWGIFHSVENQWLFNASIHLMRGFCLWRPWAFSLLFSVIVLLYVFNYHFQKKAVYQEISKQHIDTPVRSFDMRFLDKFGIVGEYLKLEIKSMFRNLVVRKQFVNGGLCMLMLCSLFSFSNIYDELPFMRVFICVYCFSCLGVMTQTSIMCAEGNYIDGLMVHKETILSLLRAKYYFQCLVLIIPVLFSLMPIMEGKLTVLTLLGCFLFTSGVVFPCLFQLAVYNDSTINLNEKITRSGKNTKIQMLVSAAAMFLPMAFMFVLVEIFSEMVASIVMASIGALGTLMHPFWLKSVYNRFMKRRYQNMESFRNSR